MTTHTHVDFPRQHPTQSHHNDTRKQYHSYTRKPDRRAHHDDAARATPFNKQPTTLLQVPDLSQRTYGRTNVYCTAHVGNQPVTVDATILSAANAQPESSCSLQVKRPILVEKDPSTQRKTRPQMKRPHLPSVAIWDHPSKPPLHTWAQDSLDTARLPPFVSPAPLLERQPTCND